MRLFMLACVAIALTGSVFSQGILDIRWNANPAGESNQLYRVYVSTNSTTVFALAGTTVGTTFTIANVPPGTYGASITASNIWGETAKSPPVYTAGPTMIPSVPTGVSILIRVQ